MGSLVFVVGKIGTGKTLYLAKCAYHSKRPVYANFKIDIASYHQLTPITLFRLDGNADIFIDEGYTWLESRTPASEMNRAISYVVLQSRKRDLSIYVSAQQFRSVDIRFRNQADYIVKCSRFQDDFIYEVLDVASGYISKWRLPFENATKYFDIYDTMEIIPPSDWARLEMGLLTGKEYNEKITSIAERINAQIYEKGYGKFTHALVRRELRELGYKNEILRKIEPAVYNELKILADH